MSSYVKINKVPVLIKLIQQRYLIVLPLNIQLIL